MNLSKWNSKIKDTRKELNGNEIKTVERGLVKRETVNKINEAERTSGMKTRIEI